MPASFPGRLLRYLLFNGSGERLDQVEGVKRVKDVVNIYARVQREIPSVLVMIGDGPERADAEAEARTLGLQDSVLFLGKIDAVAPLLSGADLFLLPSSNESFGLSALEALACGVPALATPVGIHPVALEGIAGAYCGPWDPAAWQAALEPHLEARDPRVDGRARAELFSADAMAGRVVAAWTDLLQDRISGPGEAL